MKFSDLQFVQHPDLPYKDAIQAIHIFPNSYGVKVCSFPGSYGFVEGLYEVSVIKGTTGNYQTCYDTPIANEILGHCDEIDVENIMGEVEELPTSMSKLLGIRAKISRENNPDNPQYTDEELDAMCYDAEQDDFHVL